MAGSSGRINENLAYPYTPFIKKHISSYINNIDILSIIL
jgi:hypothetical protein